MRILAFSDLHRNVDVARKIVEASQQADVVVGAGDFATKGAGLRDTLDLLGTITVPTLLVAGNHDKLDEMRAICRDWSSIHVLHGESRNIDGTSFFGLGYEIPPGRDEPWNQQLDEVEATNVLRACPEGAVLVTHSPPYGVADMQSTGVHEGSHAIGNTIIAAKVRLNLCGHIHHAWGTSGVIGGCHVHNLGPRVRWFTVP